MWKSLIEGFSLLSTINLILKSSLQSPKRLRFSGFRVKLRLGLEDAFERNQFNPLTENWQNPLIKLIKQFSSEKMNLFKFLAQSSCSFLAKFSRNLHLSFYFCIELCQILKF